jgi:thioredoxin 1
MKTVTSADFEAEVLKSDKPVLVDFFADWCPPCKQLSPILEKIAKEKAADLKIVKVDVDASPEIAKQYSIKSMPTLLIVRDGDVIAQKIGSAPKSEVVKWIDQSLALPAGTRLDLAPKTSLTSEDKQRLRDVWNALINQSPDADIPTTRLTADGSETTLRKVYTEALDNGEIFKGTLDTLSEGFTLDDIIDDLNRTGLSLPPEPVSLSDSDKKRLRDLFNEVVKVLDTPAADKQAIAMREELKADLASGAVFKQVETVLASTAGALTLDGYIDNIRKTFKIPKAPKP